jgi:hypothetical protein
MGGILPFALYFSFKRSTGRTISPSFGSPTVEMIDSGLWIASQAV